MYGETIDHAKHSTQHSPAGNAFYLLRSPEVACLGFIADVVNVQRETPIPLS